jgi:hypothetical protein
LAATRQRHDGRCASQWIDCGVSKDGTFSAAERIPCPREPDSRLGLKNQIERRLGCAPEAREAASGHHFPEPCFARLRAERSSAFLRQRCARAESSVLTLFADTHEYRTKGRRIKNHAVRMIDDRALSNHCEGPRVGQVATTDVRHLIAMRCVYR